MGRVPRAAKVVIGQVGEAESNEEQGDRALHLVALFARPAVEKHRDRLEGQHRISPGPLGILEVLWRHASTLQAFQHAMVRRIGYRQTACVACLPLRRISQVSNLIIAVGVLLEGPEDGTGHLPSL